MSKTQVKKIVKMYGQALRRTNFPFIAIYLYGSHARGEAKKWSDIDVAVISKRFDRERDKDRLLLWQTRRGVDIRIEPLALSAKAFRECTHPLAGEVREHGIRVL